MLRSTALLLATALCLSAQTAPTDILAPFDVQAMLKLKRISEPHLSPDGKTVVFTVQTVDVDKNTKPRQVYSVPLEGGTPKQLTTDGNNSRPKWMPDGQRIAILSTRGGTPQIWTIAPDGSDPKQVTSLPTGADGLLPSPDGKFFLYTSDVYPDCQDDACNKAKLDAEAKNLVKARSYTTLLYRHWTEFQGAKRKHLMIAPAEGGKSRDLTPGNRDVPPFSLGGPDDYAISPDSKEVAYSANPDPELATSTNSEVFVVPVEGGEPKRISTSPGADSGPAYSPDGKMLAWRSQARGGYESDRWKLVVLDREKNKISVITDSLDRPVQSFAWTPDSQRIFFVAEDRGRAPIYLINAKGGPARTVVSGNSHFDDVQLTPDGKTMVFTQVSGSKPAELYRAASGGAAIAMTGLNQDVLSQYALTPLEEFWVDSTDKTRVHSFVVKPAGFQAGRKYPVLFLIHGGPEGAWGESWSYRWNPQVFASAGYVVVMPNPRGSTGYGQKFTEDIQADWGGKAYEDIMAVADHVAKLPYTDGSRMAAAGGSYGGYMINWILGHTDRFKALISHAGVFDLRSMAGETEELWFVTWEFKGMPWDNPEVYAKWSPSYYVKDFKTPTLVLHGELDYRVPVGQGMQLFTALQMQKVPSKVVLFPDEGHWILKPQNTVLWYNSFLDWVGEWTKKGG